MDQIAYVRIAIYMNGGGSGSNQTMYFDNFTVNSNPLENHTEIGIIGKSAG